MLTIIIIIINVPSDTAVASFVGLKKAQCLRLLLLLLLLMELTAELAVLPDINLV